MKSENVLLTICLIVISIFIGGLTVQSCKSSKSASRTRLDIDTASFREETKTIWADSTLWESLKANFKIEWVQEKYTPVQDSTGAVTSSVLTERNSVTSSKEEQRESAAIIRKEEESAVKSSASGKTQLADDIKKESKTKTPITWQFYIMLSIVVIALWVWRKFKPPNNNSV